MASQHSDLASHQAQQRAVAEEPVPQPQQQPELTDDEIVERIEGLILRQKLATLLLGQQQSPPPSPPQQAPKSLSHNNDLIATAILEQLAMQNAGLR